MDTQRFGTGIIASVFAEFVGSFYFSFSSSVATTYWPQYSESSVVNVAILSGLSLAVITHCTSGISNGYVNPVVTVALYLTQRLSRLKFFLYIPAQILGAIIGAAFHYGVTPKQKRDLQPKTPFANDLNLMQGFVIEFALAILFIFALFMVLFDIRYKSCECRNNHGAAWKIGLIYSLCVIVDFPYTSGCLVPTWSLGLAIVRNKWGSYQQQNHWAYWIAPILGGALGGTLFEIWTSASELNDIERYGHFKRMVALLVMLVLFITVSIVITLAL